MSEIIFTTAEGRLEFVRAGGKDADICICCDGPHIYGMRLNLEGVKDGWGKPVTEVQRFVENFVWQKKKGKPIFEGKRVRVTVEIIEAE